MGKPGNTGLRRIIRAMDFSMKGLAATWRHEAAFRQESVLMLPLIPTAIWLGENGLQQSLLIGALLLVLIVELINSAIESAVDRLGNEQHELAGRAKDQGSAAVLLTLLLAFVFWAGIALDRFL